MLSNTVEGPSAESTPYRENRGASSAVCGSMSKSSILEITWHPSVPCQPTRPHHRNWAVLIQHTAYLTAEVYHCQHAAVKKSNRGRSTIIYTQNSRHPERFVLDTEGIHLGPPTIPQNWGACLRAAQIKAHLHVPLRLLECAHDSEGAEQVALWVGGQARDDGVVGPLARPQAVGVLGVQYEAVPPVLQREAAPLGHNACTYAQETFQVPLYFEADLFSVMYSQMVD